MLKMLIAEDEYLAGESLKNIEWNRVGITVCGVAPNGEQALKIAKSERPDIIISDIEMPKMSGLELARAVSDILPETKTIILTAYSKFEYAQKSVSLGVFEYLLKPFDDDSLVSVVKAAVEEIKEERSKTLKFKNVSQQLESSKYFLRSYFFQALKNNKLPGGDLLSVFGNLKTDSKCIAMAVSVKNTANAESFGNNYKTFLDLTKIIKKYKENVIPFFDISSMAFLFTFNPQKSDGAANGEVQKISESVSDYLKFSGGEFVIGIGKTVEGLANAEYSYNGAVDALSYSFYLGFNTAISISDVEPGQNSVDYFKFYDEGFLNYIKVGDSASAANSVRKLFAAFRANHEALSTVQRICNEIFVRISMCLLQCGQNPDHLFNKSDVWMIIKNFNEIDSLEEHFLKITDVTVSHINFGRNNKNKDLIDKIKDYINKNPATSLNEIAEHFFHSPNYLSNIFSNETGETVKNYILSTRVNMAKKLLCETQKSIYEVALEVGYKNPQHFSNMFKNHVGVTPSVFRTNNHKN